MKTLSDLEKDVIAHLCSIKDLSKEVAICDIITKFCPCSLKWDEESVTIFYDTNEYHANFVLNRLITVICLFEYLQTQSLIYVFKRTNVKERKELINFSLNHSRDDNNNITHKREIPIHCENKFTVNGKTFTFGDKAIALRPLSKVDIPWNFTQLVDIYSNSVVFCTETLRHIKNQNYKDDATIQYEKSRCQTWVAIAISFLVGLFGCIGTFMSYFQNEKFHKENIKYPLNNTIKPDTVKLFKPNVDKDTLTIIPIIKSETLKLHTNNGNAGQ